MLDPLTQGFVNRSAVAASGFAANFLFWTRGGYSQLTLPEPLLHFWSLAVEEQFYLFWPLLLLAVVRMGGHFRRLATTVAVAVAVASFAFCVAITPSRQPMAFYFLPARAWELAAGALLALAGPALFTGRERLRAVLAWAGLGGIVLCVLRFDDPQYGFPGVKAAVPVLATVLVIVGGVRAPSGPGVLLGQPLMQWIGKRSYALYLWHYPILVLVAATWGPLSGLQRAGLLAVSFVAAALSFALVEDPIRRSTWLAERPGRSVGLGAGLATAGVMTAVVLLSVPQDLSAGTAAQAARIVVAEDPGADPTATTGTGADPATADAPVTGDTAPDGTSPTGETSPGDTSPDTNTVTADDDAVPANPESVVRLAADNADALEEAAANDLVPSNLRPSLRDAYDDRPGIYRDGCLLGGNETQPGECVYGTPGAATTVVLFGDSHAAQWFPAFESVARRHGWELVVMTKQACPTGDVPLQIAGQTSECRRWREKVLERLRSIEPDLLVMASFRYRGTNASMWRDGLATTMAAFRPVADRVLILGDTPTPKGDVPSCVAAHLRSLTRCNTDRSDAVRDHWLAADATVAAAYDAQLITTGDWLCAAEECPVVLGDVLLYRDESHLTTDAAELLEPYVDASLRAVLRG
jgi:peptidoglycan/LPS O-acetylase OafA/YrhL